MAWFRNRAALDADVETSENGKETFASKCKQDPVASFLSWCTIASLEHPKCTIGQLPDTGRGVVATAVISAGEVVIEVPDDAVLMVESSCIADELEESGLAKGVASDPLLEIQGLVLAVMAEKAKGKRSTWAPYLDFIPSDMSHMPMFWQESELSELRGTAALDKMEGKVQTPADAPTQVRMLWEDLAEPFIQLNAQLDMPTGERGWELYQWATAAVSSYSFILGDDRYQAMVPFWDALNHITGAVNVRLNHHVTKGAGCLQMIATRDIAAGEELVNNYGELSQAELLRAYGYVERHKQADMYSHVQVPLKFVLQAVAAVVQPAQAAGGHQPASTGSQSDPENQGIDCGSDSDGHSEFGLDTESEEAADGETEAGQEGEDAGDEEQAGGNGARANGKTGAGAERAGGAGAVVGAGRAPEDGRGLAARCGVVRMRAVRAAVRGLPGRLRFMRRVGLLPRANVIKVYAPTAQDAPQPGSATLAECVRMLLLPHDAFCTMREAVMAWRPEQDPTADGKVVDVGPRGTELSAQVQQVVCCVAEHMLGRYTCSLEADEQLLAETDEASVSGPRASDDAGGAKSAARRLSAVVARLPEKRCLKALISWWGWGAGEAAGGGEVAVQRLLGAVGECWSQPRPGMFGMPSAGVDSEEGDDSEEDESSDSGGGGDGETSEGEAGDGSGGEEGQGTEVKGQGVKRAVVTARSIRQQAAEMRRRGAAKEEGGEEAEAVQHGGHKRKQDMAGGQNSVPPRKQTKTDTGFTFAFNL